MANFGHTVTVHRAGSSTPKHVETGLVYPTHLANNFTNGTRQSAIRNTKVFLISLSSCWS